MKIGSIIGIILMLCKTAMSSCCLSSSKEYPETGSGFHSVSAKDVRNLKGKGRTRRRKGAGTKSKAMMHLAGPMTSLLNEPLSNQSLDDFDSPTPLPNSMKDRKSLNDSFSIQPSSLPSRDPSGNPTFTPSEIRLNEETSDSPSLPPLQPSNHLTNGSSIEPSSRDPTFAPSISESIALSGILADSMACNLTDIQHYVFAFTSTNEHNIFYEKALAWLLEDKKCLPEAKLIQRFAMAVFYLSTNGDSWAGRTHWMSEIDECQWYGITCDDTGFITTINLNNNNVDGKFPSDWKAIPSLQSLELFNNKLNGAIPESIGSLTSLELLDIEGNMLSGDLSAFISNIGESLQKLRVSFNAFEGTIPRNIDKFVKLREFWSARMNISGSIPDSLFDLKNLESLYIYENNLSGALPQKWNTKNLKQLDISSNYLIGSIPKSIGDLTLLQRLHLGDNSLTGSIPTAIGNLKELTTLVLSNNHLMGPVQINQLVNLNVIQLNDNKLNSTIPNVENTTNLVFFDLTNNQFDGMIPESLFELNKLKYLYLGHNMLSGTIPDLCQSSRNIVLQDLFLNNNLLVGHIPSCIPSSVTELLLNKNKLIGAVPESLCDYRAVKLSTLWADCKATESETIQNTCPLSCCTFCTVGKVL